MYYLENWRQRWGISTQAINELHALMGIANDLTHVSFNGDAESVVQQKIRYESAKIGVRLWRNNVGVLKDDRGIPVRYGLANESKKMNKLLKSSDLIGITPLYITSQHVGQTVGVFTSYEVKKNTWRWRGNSHEQAQLNWINLVISLGGIGRFVQ